MATVRDIFDYLNDRAPFALQEDYDNSGFLVGRGGAEVTQVLISLDITPEVVREAADLGAQLIVTHHPAIFTPIKSVTEETAEGQVLLALNEAGIAHICMHTNLDVVAGGVNDVLARMAGLIEIDPLFAKGLDAMSRPYGMGRVGRLPAPVPLLDFAASLKQALGTGGLRYYDAGRPVSHVAVGGGACGDLLWDAVRLGCDTFVSGDLKYSIFRNAQSLGVNVIDAGHYATENPVCPVVADWLREGFPALAVNLTQVHCEQPRFL